jgi:hypothetical protein
MAAFIQIPKTMSSPADPDTPSFLTNLPAEIRNAVYEVLFKRDEPVLLHNAEAYHTIEPPRDIYAAPYTRPDFMKDFHTTFEAEIGRDEEFRHNLANSMPLLRSCRQIFHEAVGMLYGQNTFIISRALGRHDCNEDDDDIDHRAYHQFTYAPIWLSSIGSQIMFVKKVIIDMDGSCPIGCWGQLEEFDLLPLLRIYWKYPHQAAAITFAHTGRHVLHHPDDGLSDPSSADLATSFTRIFDALVRHDELELQRYAKHERLLKEVIIQLQEPAEGYMTFTSSHASGEYKSYFDFDTDTGVIRRQGSGPEPALYRLPRPLQHKIFDFALATTQNVVFNLDTRNLRGFDLTIFHISQHTRSSWGILALVSLSRPITIQMTSQTATISSAQFEALKEFLPRSSIENYGLFPDILFGDYEEAKPLTLSLKLDISTTITLTDVRIDIQGLTDFLRQDCFPSNSVLHIALQCPRGRSIHTEDARVEISRLRWELFLVLSDLIASMDVQHAASKNTELPEIIMDGHGMILHVSSPATGTYPATSVQNRHSRLRNNEVRQRGYWMAGTLDHYHTLFRRTVPYQTNEWPSMLAVWGDLRADDWSDWEVRRLPTTKGLYA